MLNPIFQEARLQHYQNKRSEREQPWPSELDQILSSIKCNQAIDEIKQWEGYQVSPLHSLESIAQELGVGKIFYKDESKRFGLGSFKALGGAYALLCTLQEQLVKKIGKQVKFSEIRQGQYAELLKEMTVATATDGNHGRSVAWGAQQFGCRCVIYIHAEVSEGRKVAMERYGAEVIRVDGNYDDSVHQAQKDADEFGYHIVSDSSYPGYMELAKDVMAGYTLLVDEALQQLTDPHSLTHVFVQGGVGGLAAAVCAYLWQQLGETRPRFIVVEPDLAPCLYQSAVQQKITSVPIRQETIMAGLSCGEVSYLAWDILEKGCDDFMTIDDALVPPLMRLLLSEYQIVAGESAVAGLAALIASCQNTRFKNLLELNEQSRIMLIGTEGNTDPEIYDAIISKKEYSLP